MRQLDDTVYSVGPNGRFALSVDCNRLLVTAVEIDTGESRLIISYADLKAFHHRPSMDRAIHWVSHIEVDPASSRIVFLHRWTERVEDETCFLHRLITADPDGRKHAPAGMLGSPIAAA